ncbi:MAG: SDR family NAD(P)-dependent oxidoreductase, partial [Traorella sp.]
MSNRLDGQVALISGAANGMGYTMVETFVKEGAIVIACDVLKNVEEKWANTKNVVPMVLDVTNSDMVDEVIHKVVEDYGKLDILCNVAGINDLMYPLDETTNEMWDRVVDIDLKGPFYTSRAAVREMKKKGYGVIINISSLAQFAGNHGASYSSAKHGLRGLTQHTAAYYFDSGIRCNAICPGGTATDIETHSGGKYHALGMKRAVECLGS